MLRYFPKHNNLQTVHDSLEEHIQWALMDLNHEGNMQAPDMQLHGLLP